MVIYSATGVCGVGRVCVCVGGVYTVCVACARWLGRGVGRRRRRGGEEWCGVVVLLCCGVVAL